MEVWGGVAKSRVHVHVHRMGMLTLHDATHTSIRASKKKKLELLVAIVLLVFLQFMKSCPKLQYSVSVCQSVT